jgi:hypothetical protein
MRRLLALIAALAVLVIAGCGGSDDKKSSTGTSSSGTAASTTKASSASYKTDVTRISQEFQAAGLAFKNSVSSQSTPQQAAAALESFQTKVNKAADELAQLQPPANVAQAHKDLTDAFRSIADACQPSIDAGKAGDRTKLRAALQTLQTELNGSLGNKAKTAASQIDAGLAGQ